MGALYDRELLERMEAIMTRESRLLAGILIIILPTVMIGGVSTATGMAGSEGNTAGSSR
jgi:hypothetical protein